MIKEVKIPINRTWVGLFAVICLAGSAAVWFYVDSDHWSQGLLRRLSLLTAAASIAIPWRGWRKAWIHVSPKTALFVLAAVVAISLRAIIAIPVSIAFLVVWFVVRPRQKKRPVPHTKMSPPK
ncbi:MAG: hypothetical protein IID45_01255 [Planctomycetes bacterium]|nr:hypothetical protein [Planctomycetota bacterium]